MCEVFWQIVQGGKKLNDFSCSSHNLGTLKIGYFLLANLKLTYYITAVFFCSQENLHCVMKVRMISKF